MKEFDALIVAHYDFVDKKNKHVETTKLLISLDKFGVVELCTPLANAYELLTVIKVHLGYKGNKFVIDSIVE